MILLMDLLMDKISKFEQNAMRYNASATIENVVHSIGDRIKLWAAILEIMHNFEKKLVTFGLQEIHYENRLQESIVLP